MQHLSDEEYKVLIKTLNEVFNVPVKERSTLHKRLLSKFWRGRKRFLLKMNPGYFLYITMKRECSRKPR